MKLIPASWKDYRQEELPALGMFTIHIEAGPIQIDDQTDNGWVLRDHSGQKQAVCVRNGKAFLAVRYVSPNEITVRVCNALDNFVRLGIQYGTMFALHESCIGLHGVTLLCDDEILILSAPSGTGKTTLSKLLEQYCDALMINGDFALLSPTEDGVIFEPTPFCGSSKRNLNHRVRVDRVIFLGQSKTNEWHELTERNTLTRFMSNVFIPTWDGKIYQTVLENILKCISVLKVNSFSFAPTREAAECLSKHLKL